MTTRKKPAISSSQTEDYDTTLDPTVKTDWAERIALLKKYGTHHCEPGHGEPKCTRCKRDVHKQGADRATANLCLPCLDELFPKVKNSRKSRNEGLGA